MGFLGGPGISSFSSCPWVGSEKALHVWGGPEFGLTGYRAARSPRNQVTILAVLLLTWTLESLGLSSHTEPFILSDGLDRHATVMPEKVPMSFAEETVALIVDAIYKKWSLLSLPARSWGRAEGTSWARERWMMEKTAWCGAQSEPQGGRAGSRGWEVCM